MLSPRKCRRGQTAGNHQQSDPAWQLNLTGLQPITRAEIDGIRAIMADNESSLRVPAIVAAVFVVGIVVTTAAALDSHPTKPDNVSAEAFRPADVLNTRDREIAAVAWAYFERNTQPATGLVNSVDNYPSTTMWDTGSTLAAFLAAGDLGLISRADEHRRINQLLTTLERLDLFNEEAPNKVYNTKTARMSNYRNQPDARGIGVSTLDLGRLVSWLQITSNIHPRYADRAAAIIERWSFCRLSDGGQMFGLGRKEDTISVLQEGRLGYEQYAARALQRLGLDMRIAASYRNRHAMQVEVEGVSIAADRRDASRLGAHNYVVAESYALDLLENGRTSENEPLFANIVEAQRRRYQRSGQVTAVSEDNIDRAPWFVYNTVFTNGKPWFTLTDRGEDMDHLKTISTKAAISMAYLQPDQPYSKTLLDSVWQARNPKGGWYSGIYEKTGQFNKATTANTNGVILSLMLHKKYGALHKICNDCGDGLVLSDAYLKSAQSAEHCNDDISRREALASARVSQRLELWARLRAQHAVDQLDEISALLHASQSQMQSGNSTGALSTLSKAKRHTWEASTTIAGQQKALRALMPEFDQLKAKWKSGNRSSDTAALVALIEKNRQSLL